MCSMLQYVVHLCQEKKPPVPFLACLLPVWRTPRRALSESTLVSSVIFQDSCGVVPYNAVGPVVL